MTPARGVTTILRLAPRRRHAYIVVTPFAGVMGGGGGTVQKVDGHPCGKTKERAELPVPQTGLPHPLFPPFDGCKPTLAPVTLLFRTLLMILLQTHGWLKSGKTSRNA